MPTRKRSIRHAETKTKHWAPDDVAPENEAVADDRSGSGGDSIVIIANVLFHSLLAYLFGEPAVPGHEIYGAVFVRHFRTPIERQFFTNSSVRLPSVLLVANSHLAAHDVFVRAYCFGEVIDIKRES